MEVIRTFDQSPQTMRVWRKKRVLAMILSVLFILTMKTISYGFDEEDTEDTPQVWSQVDHYAWMHASNGASLSDFSFFINDSEAKNNIRTLPNKTTFHVIFSLSRELNTIEIKYLGQTIVKKDVYYYPGFESELVPEEAVSELFHTASNESSCSATECHRLVVTATDSAPTDIKKQICYQCHSHKFDAFTSVHKPAATEWRCLQCHIEEYRETDLSPDEPLRFTIKDLASTASLCYKCHKKLQTFIESKKHIHGPIGMGACTMCHSPHGSKYKKLLLNETSSLCIDCHDAQKMLDRPIVHKVMTQKNKGCTACHHPHSSNYPFQLISDITKLCYECHPQIAKSKDNHPVQRHPVFVKEKPPLKGYKVSCVKCHSPHSSEFEKLLPEEEMMMLCSRCHTLGAL